MYLTQITKMQTRNHVIIIRMETCYPARIHVFYQTYVDRKRFTSNVLGKKYYSNMKEQMMHSNQIIKMQPESPCYKNRSEN